MVLGWVDSKTARMDLSGVSFAEPQQDRTQEAQEQDRPQTEYVLKRPLELKYVKFEVISAWITVTREFPGCPHAAFVFCRIFACRHYHAEL